MFKKFFQFLIGLFSIVVGFSSSSVPVIASAAESISIFDNTSVMSDLEDSTIKGEKFNPDKYLDFINEDIVPLAFAERGYNSDVDNQKDYSLYFYLANPLGFRIEESEQNMLTMSIGGGEYNKYHLSLCNYSPAPYENIFYKYRVDLSEEERVSMLEALDPNERVYDISGVELMDENKYAIEYTIGEKYIYSGFSEGYGSDEDTLHCAVYSRDTLFLEPQFTAYRLEGNNGTNKYTQDSLHSVYFAVPNDILEKYGEINAIRATWLNAILNPIIVTQNKTMYDNTVSYLGTTNLGSYKYRFFGDPHFYLDGGVERSMSFDYYWGNNTSSAWGGVTMDVHYNNNVYEVNTYKDNIDPLYMMFLVDNIKESFVSSNSLQDKMLITSAALGGDMVLDRYSKSLFQHVDKKFTTLDIFATDELSLDKYVCDQTWWDKLWGIDKYVNKSMSDIKAIEPVTNLSGTDTVISRRYLVDYRDVNDFVSYCDEAAKNDSTVYLLRYQISDYFAQDLLTCDVVYDSSQTLVDYRYKKTVANGWDSYVVQETVNLGFDIIELDFKDTEGKEMVMPVVMSPVDIIPGLTPPLDDDLDISWLFWLIVGVVGVIFLSIFPLTKPLMNIVWKGVWYAFAWPYYLICAILHKRGGG